MKTTAHQIKVLDGLTIAYRDVGTGSPVVFLHGSGPGASGWSNFSANAEALAQSGFRAIVPDMIGYGASDKPADKAYTLDFFQQSIEAFLDSLDITSCVLVGNSLGGALAIKLALASPQRFEKLILMAPGSLEETKTYMRMKGIQKMAMTFMSPERNRDDLKETLKAMVHNKAFITDALVDERFEVFSAQPTEVLSTMQVPYQGDALAQLKCPVLAFWGMNDDLCPVSGADTLMKGCPHVRAHLIGNCGHWVMVEYRDLFNRMVVDFLQNG